MKDGRGEQREIRWKGKYVADWRKEGQEKKDIDGWMDGWRKVEQERMKRQVPGVCFSGVSSRTALPVEEGLRNSLLAR